MKAKNRSPPKSIKIELHSLPVCSLDQFRPSFIVVHGQQQAPLCSLDRFVVQCHGSSSAGTALVESGNCMQGLFIFNITDIMPASPPEPGW